MATRSPDEIQHSIERTRRELATSVEELRIKVKVLTDWRRQINEHRTAAIAGAAVLGFVVGGGFARLPPPPLARYSTQARRHAADAQQARPDVGADHRPDLGDEERRTAHDLLASRRSAARPRRAPGCAARPRRRRRRRGAAPRTRPGAAAPCAPVRTRSIGVISLSSVRIGLIFSAEPSHADAAPIRPPRRRYSSVSTANHIFRSARASLRSRSTTSSRRRAGLRGARPASVTSPRPPAAALGVDHRDPVGPLPSASCSFACRAVSTVPEMPPEMWTETTSSPCVDERLVDVEEVADRRLGGGRQPVGAPQPVVEVVEVRHVRAPARWRPPSSRRGSRAGSRCSCTSSAGR